MKELPHTNAAENDRAKHDATKVGDLTTLLRHAAQKSGRSSLKIGNAFTQMTNSAARLGIVEFVRWKLYDPERFTDDQRAEFISNRMHWPIINTICDNSWNGAAEDKVLADTILRTSGVPVPTAIGVIDKSSRIFPGLTKVGTAEDLRDLVLAHAGQELFGKIINGMVSFGAFWVTAADQTHIMCKGHDPMTYSAFINEFVGDNAYLIQKTLTNHDKFASYCTALATVRMINLVGPGSVDNPVAIIKLPQGDNISDAFWRPGNLISEVDVDTGEIKTIVALNSPDLDFLDDHPTVSGLMGLRLPYWDELKEINERAARTYAPIRYNSTDIAITPDGPVMVELNYGGGFDLPQNASGRGFLTPNVKAFFEENGYSFGRSSAKPGKRGFKLFGKRK